MGQPRVTDQRLIDKVRQVQQAEGSRPCFRTGVNLCPHAERCCWWEICDHAVVHTFEVTGNG